MLTECFRSTLIGDTADRNSLWQQEEAWVKSTTGSCAVLKITSANLRGCKVTQRSSDSFSSQKKSYPKWNDILPLQCHVYLQHVHVTNYFLKEPGPGSLQPELLNIVASRGVFPTKLQGEYVIKEKYLAAIPESLQTWKKTGQDLSSTDFFSPTCTETQPALSKLD